MKKVIVLSIVLFLVATVGFCEESDVRDGSSIEKAVIVEYNGATCGTRW